MTNCRDRFALFKEMAGKLDCVVVGAQRVRVHEAAGNHQRIEVIRSRVVEYKINIEFVALVGVMHALDLSGFERNDFCFRAGFIERLSRFCHFHLFKTIRHQNGHLLSFQFSRHKSSR